MRCYFLLGAATCALAIPVSASAQSTAPSSQASAAPASSQAQSSDTDDTIIVTAPFRRQEEDILQGTSVVTGEDLQRELRPTLGETLARQPGVSATSFGPNASRPILRGFQGERIRVLTGGIGSIDVSNTSVDHPVVIDPLLAERVEVLRGPSALLFGSSAIGGVVNVIDKRIPRAIPENGFSVDGIATYGSASNERSVAGAADAAIGSQFVVHADGSYTKTDDLRIPGYVLSPEARKQALATAALPQPAPGPDEEPIDFAANAALRDRLPDTASETWTAGFGGALITDTGNLGVSYSHYDSLFGVPVRYATKLGEEQEAPRLDVAQDRPAVVDKHVGVHRGAHVFCRAKHEGERGNQGLACDRIQRRNIHPVQIQPSEDRYLQRVFLLSQLGTRIDFCPQTLARALLQQCLHVGDGLNCRVSERLGIRTSQDALSGSAASTRKCQPRRGRCNRLSACWAVRQRHARHSEDLPATITSGISRNMCAPSGDGMDTSLRMGA